ncbi:hypothetical protein ABIB57_001936 [Devosia sp. UYZn731]|uniref:S8 family peptidase n=1 Tax=Devosia sp. UYZn731 TaxID=3156345 RepID=UPI00339A2A1F
MATFRHLHIRGLGVAPTEFRARPGRSAPKDIPAVPDRRAHAEKLREDLDRAVAVLSTHAKAQARHGVDERQRGVAITIDGRPNMPFAAGDSSARSPGIKLLSVRRSPRVSDVDEERRNEPEEVMADSATFFVTANNIKTLRANLERYADWDDTLRSVNAKDDAPRRPNGFWMFETGGSMRASSIKDLWTDGEDRFPRAQASVEWEVWTKKGFEGSFESAVRELEIELDGKPTEFVGINVRTVVATHEQIQKLIEDSAAVVELRGASSFGSDFLTSPPEARASVAALLASRVTAPDASAPRVAVLDTGVQFSNPLLAAALAPADCHTIVDGWTASDHSGHGTKMAGVVQYTDIGRHALSIAPIPQWTRLESVVVNAPANARPVSARDAIARAVNLLERTPAPRVYCLAQTARGEATDGRITSTAAALDLLTYSDGKAPRLFCVAAGNVPYSAQTPYLASDYADRNRMHGMESPAQSFNAIAVGASTLKAGGQDTLVAPAGDLNPTSRTSESWRGSHANKPDIVMEGGNFAMADGGVWAHPSPENLILTTSHAAPKSPLSRTGQTSAATAQASGLLGRLMAQYPNYRMESLRGLLVHSAEWTPAMAEQLEQLEDATSRSIALGKMLARYGWGIPNEQRAYLSTDSALTMIIEDHLTPFGDGKNGIVLKEMKYFKLPWPVETLRALRQQEVELRCTLSYFVEPDPNAISRDHYERYPSFRLKFGVKRPNESHEVAEARFNDASDEVAQRGDPGWLLGSTASHRGSLHQDVWRGPAYQLADRDGISVAPIGGWWADRPDLDRYRRAVNFSLIVSLRLPVSGTNLITETVRAAAPAVVVESPVVITV